MFPLLPNIITAYVNTQKSVAILKHLSASPFLSTTQQFLKTLIRVKFYLQVTKNKQWLKKRHTHTYIILYIFIVPIPNPFHPLVCDSFSFQHQRFPQLGNDGPWGHFQYLNCHGAYNLQRDGEWLQSQLCKMVKDVSLAPLLDSKMLFPFKGFRYTWMTEHVSRHSKYSFIFSQHLLYLTLQPCSNK